MKYLLILLLLSVRGFAQGGGHIAGFDLQCNHIWIIPQPDTVVIPISPKITTKPWNPYSRYEKGPSLICIKCHQEKQQVIFHKGNDLEPLPDSVQQIKVDSISLTPVVTYKMPPIPRVSCPAYTYYKRDWIVYRHDHDSLAYRYYSDTLNAYILKHFKKKSPTIWVELVDSGYNLGWYSDQHPWKQGLHIQVPRGTNQSDQLERLVDFALKNLRMLKDLEKAIRDFDQEIDPECAYISQDLIERILQWDYRKR